LQKNICYILKFADDTKIFTRITDDNDWHSLQDDYPYPNFLLGLKSGTCFLIPVNVKSCILANHKKKYPYYMNNQQLEEVTQEKDLGVKVLDAHQYFRYLI